MKTLIKKIPSKKYGFAVVIIALFIVTYILLFTNPKDWQNFYHTTLNSNVKSNKSETTSTKQDDSSVSSKNKIYADLNGDNKDEYVILNFISKAPFYTESVVAYDSSEKEIGKTPKEIVFSQPMEGSAKKYKLESKTNKEYISFEFIAGTHQSEIMFIELFDNKILPVCLKEKIIGLADCLFYSGEVGDLQVQDLNNDGFMEVVEYRDEYPTSSELTREENDAIEKVFSEKDLMEQKEAMKKIAMREKGGRGRRIVWGIYRYNDEYFEEQLTKNYDKYFALLIKAQSNLIKKSDLSKDSLEYSGFVRKFWANR